MTEKDENDESVQAQYDKAFGGYSKFAVVHGSDDSDDYQRITIYQFGASMFNGLGGTRMIDRIDIDMETHSYTSSCLTNVSCPHFATKYGHMHVVFCKKSQTIHVFGQKFERHMHYSIKLQTLSNAQTLNFLLLSMARKCV